MHPFRSVAVVALLGCWASCVVAQLDPPVGPVSLTMKPLDAIEPRRVLNDLSGDEGATVLVTAPGSYYLSGDLLGEAGKHGIRVVTAGPVTIDLNGFDVVGAAGSLNGIDMDLGQVGVAGSRVEIVCPDGSGGSVVSGWGGDGVRTSGVVHCVVSNVEAADNAGNGLSHLHSEAVIHRDVATRANGGDGTSVTPVPQATAGRGVTNRFARCRARSNGGSGWVVEARADSYSVDIRESLACGNLRDGFFVRELGTILGAGGGAGTIEMRDLTCRDQVGEGVRIEIPCASPTVIVADGLTCVANGLNGLHIDAIGTAVPHFGATAMISNSMLSSNNENGLRSENPLHATNTTVGENALYGVNVSGGDDSTCVLEMNVCHLAANGSGGAIGGPGRFMKTACAITDNGGPGIETLDGCLLLTDCSVTNNNGAGVITNGTLNVTSSNFRRNTGPGVVCVNGECVADEMVCEFNGSVGDPGGMVFVDCPSVTLRRCVSNGNVGDGVRASSSVGPIRWMAPEMMVSNNTGDGMHLSDCVGARLQRCVSSGNGGAGFVLDATCTRAHVSGCTSMNDAGGGFFVLGSGNLVMGCAADASAAGAFNIAANNGATVVIDAAAVAANRFPDPNVRY
ncbi:MAG: right-handed parallel beta-helix repeat-containing protein [Planctomycetota bacterium]